jgi:hypothetical protein
MSPPRIGILLLWCLAASAPCWAAGSPPERTVLVLGSPSGPVERALVRELHERRLRMALPATLGPAATDAANPERATLERVETSLRQAQKLYYDVRIADAATLLEQEIRSASPTLARARRFDLLRALHLWAGVCALKKGDSRAARHAFAAAVLLDDRPPDDVRFSPAVTTTFAAVREEIRRQPRSLLVVEAAPAQAKVTVDGRPWSAAPLRLPPGQHWVVAEALGYLPAVRVLHLERGETTRVTLSLSPGEQSLVRRQLHARAARGELDPLAPDVALALCLLQSADESLLVREVREGARLRLFFTRLSCASGRALGGHEEVTAPDRAEDAAHRAVETLWALTPLATPKTEPLYKRWWFWTAVGLGAAAVGGTVAGVLWARRGDTYTIHMTP